MNEDRLKNTLSLEEAILGTILIDFRCIDIVLANLIEDDFYYYKNAQLFGIFKKMAESHKKIDLITTFEEINKIKTELDISYLMEISNKVGSSTNIETHIEYLKSESILRQCLMFANGIVKDVTSLDIDPSTILNNLIQTAKSLQDRTVIQRDITFKEKFKMTVDECFENEGKDLIGTKTGFETLDKIMGGLVGPDLTVLAAGAGEGKCLGFGTKVMLSNGDLKEVQDLKVGEKLMGVDGGEREILSLARGVDQLYRIDQNKGISYVVNSNHILSLRMNYSTKNIKSGDIVNLTVKDYLSKTAKFKQHAKGYKSSCLIFEKQDVPIDPYFLGIWLGDGTSACSNITTADFEVVNYLENYSKSLDHSFKMTAISGLSNTYSITNGKSYLGKRNSLQAKLSKENLINNKHIPKVYLLNDKQTRLTLLAGIIDSDGYLSKGYQYEVVFKNYNLAKDVTWLARSLGYSVSMKECRKTCTNNNVTGTYYRIYINGNISEIPVIVERRKNPKRTINKNPLNTGISVTPIGVDNYYGFELDGDGLFLLEDFTVTHNTSYMLNIAKHISTNYGDVIIFSYEMKERQLIWKLMSDDLSMSVKEIRLGKFDKDYISKTKIYNAKLHIYDKGSITIHELCSIAKMQVKKLDLKVIIVDYLQLVKIGNYHRKISNKGDEVGVISNQLKQLAMELNIPIIALSQVSRDKNRKRYRKEDLRETGAIEQDADNIVMIFRPVEHDMDEYFIGKQKIECNSNTAIINIEKCRLGDTGEFVMKFNGRCSRFEDLKSEEIPF